MPNLTHVPLRMVFEKDQHPMWHAQCDTHQWAVKDGNVAAVEALIREHTREHPTVHCPPPPPPGPIPRYPLGSWPQKWKLTEIHLTSGEVLYSGQCGQCPYPGWNVLDHRSPVDAYMQQHWVAAHADEAAAEEGHA